MCACLCEHMHEQDCELVHVSERVRAHLFECTHSSNVCVCEFMSEFRSLKVVSDFLACFRVGCVWSVVLGHA